MYTHCLDRFVHNYWIWNSKNLEQLTIMEIWRFPVPQAQSLATSTGDHCVGITFSLLRICALLSSLLVVNEICWHWLCNVQRFLTVYVSSCRNSWSRKRPRGRSSCQQIHMLHWKNSGQWLQYCVICYSELIGINGFKDHRQRIPKKLL